MSPHRARSTLRSACAGVLAFLGSFLSWAVVRPGAARADVTSWMALGGGYAGQVKHATASFDTASAFSYSLGVGSTPIASLVFGGLVRGTTMFGLGTDLGPVVRAATGGFARGDWGVALDAGVLWRSWGSDAYGTWPVQGVLTVGAPWGLQLAMGGQIASVAGGTPSKGFFASLELDLLRFTVMRQGPTERWWPNPAPAGGHPKETRPPGTSARYGWPDTPGGGRPSSALIE